MSYNKIRTINSSKFTYLLSNDDLLQINANYLSILSCQSGTVKQFYFLPQIPIKIFINPNNTSKLILIYPPKGNQGESLVVLETFTGQIWRQIILKNSNQSFQFVSVGTYVYFVLSNELNLIYYCPFGEGLISQLITSEPIVQLIAHPEESLIYFLTESNFLISITPKDNSIKSQKMIGNYSFIRFVGINLAIGNQLGEIQVISNDDSKTKSFSTPNLMPPILMSENIAVTSDGVVFQIDSCSKIIIMNGINSIFSSNYRLILVTEKDTHILELFKKPICSSYMFSPTEPFNSTNVSIDSSLFFYKSNVIYSYNILQREISTFYNSTTTINIQKIVSTFASVSVLYIQSNISKLMTFVTGTKNRDESAIDVIIDKKGLTWVLQSDSILSFQRKLLSLEQKDSISIDPNLGYNKIFLFNNTIAIYNDLNGNASYLKDQKLISFQLPSNIINFKWPAFNTLNQLYIFKGENLIPNSNLDYLILNEQISSYIWLAWTLFYIKDNKIYAIGKNSKKREILLLSDYSSILSCLLPTEIIIISSLPDTHVIVYKQPIILQCLVDCENNIEIFSRILNFIPTQPLNPLNLININPLILISTIIKTKVSFINEFIIDTYIKFGLFSDIYNLIQEYKCNNEIKKYFAFECKKFGQFNYFQKICLELKDYLPLFELYIILRQSHNLKVLANVSNLAPVIKYVGFEPLNEEFEDILNYPLPKTKNPIKQSEFYIYFGDISENKQLYPSLFDEISDFSQIDIIITGNESETIAEKVDLLNPIEDNQQDKPPENIEYKEKPVETKTEIDKSLGLDKFFSKEPEQKGLSVLEFGEKISKPKVKNLGNFVANFKLDNNSNTINPRKKRLGKSLAPSNTQEILDINTNEENDNNDMNFQSTFFLPT